MREREKYGNIQVEYEDPDFKYIEVQVEDKVKKMNKVT